MKNRRTEIIGAARTLFTHQGYQQASMSDIIAATGLSAGAIYNHFSGKTEMMAAAARIDMSTFETRSGELPWEYVERCLQALDADRDLTRFLAITWGEAATVPAIALVVEEQLTELKARVTGVYRGWAEAELDFTPAELESWLAMLTTAVLSVLTGFVVQKTNLAEFDSRSYFAFAQTILRQA